MQDLKLGVGDQITVYKANMIIPQLDENLTAGDNPPIPIPGKCPVYGSSTELRIGADGLTESLYCTNPECAAKHIGMFERFVCRDGLNVVGLSTSKLEQLIDHGFIQRRSDLFKIDQHKNEISHLDGWGMKSAQKLLDAVSSARATTFRQFFYSLGIPGCGHDVAKILEKEFLKKYGSSKKVLLKELFSSDTVQETLAGLDGIGEVRAKAMKDWYGESQNAADCDLLMETVSITDDIIESAPGSDSLKGLNFVVTGAVYVFNYLRVRSLPPL